MYETIWAWLGLYSFVFVCVLVASPREIYDSEYNVDYRRVGWYALLFFMLVVCVFALVRLFLVRVV